MPSRRSARCLGWVDTVWPSRKVRPSSVSSSELSRGQGGQRGSATVELAVLFPTFLVLVFGGVQAAQWYHVRSLCLAAADTGVQTGRKVGASDADARRAAAGFLVRAGAGTASEPAVSTTGSTPAQVRVEVSASVPRVIPLPGLSMRVTQSAQATRERFTVPDRTTS